MIKPFTPAEAIDAKGDVIPKFVLQAVNQLLATKLTGNSATFTQNEVMELAYQLGTVPGGELVDSEGKLLDGYHHQWFFDKGWLNFEELYASHGWKVSYTKPDYTESFPAYFTFKVRGT